MCGITGILTNTEDLNLIRYLNLMNDTLVHRGPDDEGIWIAKCKQVGLGFRRLSIVDLSNNGHQPMKSASGRYSMVFNGEIYNFKDIKYSLNQEFNNTIIWTSTSDSEILIEAFDKWGLEKTLNKLVGMFAIALWDNFFEKLHLIRDRVGEKPLYYGWINNNSIKLFVFSSELKAIKVIPEFNNKISKIAISKYLKLMYIPAPLSIYENMYKLEPACLLTVDKTSLLSYPNSFIKPDTASHNISISRWWKKEKNISLHLKSRNTTESELINSLDNAIENSVSLQMESDVNTGAFLSGGVDSSLIASTMQRLSSQKIQTFTLGFEEAEFDESVHANEIAKIIGTNHYVQTINSKDSLKIIDKLPIVYDEPFADSSQIPTILLSIFAKKKISVVLTGDGADELFGGYERYIYSYKLWSSLNLLPYEIRKIIGTLGHSIPTEKIIYILKLFKIINQSNNYNFSKKIQNLSNKLLNINSVDSLDMILKSSSLNLKDIYKYYNPLDTNHFLTQDIYTQNNLNSKERIVSHLMNQDFSTYLPDDILCKVDRAAMFSSLENRTPFLDHRIIEIAENIPFNMKFRNKTNKWILKEIAYKYIPKKILIRPKKGFSIPLDDWLRGPLFDWAENLLNEKKLNDGGFFNTREILKKWNEHKLFVSDHGTDLWTILMFQAWLEVQ
jgi:asparagine synthase (glutamine-hydrolysing)